MPAPTAVQKAVLEKMQGYRVVLQLTTGEVVIVPGRDYRYAKVIDTDGQVYGYHDFMTTREHRRRTRTRGHSEK